ncbi:hypothetical protein [Actinomadura sp. WMMB 499]|nr:hypothetical protein [Actinomadura sp. WMMB 499]
MTAPSLRTRLGRVALTAFVRGSATAAGAAVISLATWWITHR